MNLVRSGFDRADNQTTPGTAVLRRRYAGGYLEFLCGVDRGKEEDYVLQAIIVVQAVQDEIVRLGTEAVNGEGTTA